jgi:replicative DNA helicase
MPSIEEIRLQTGHVVTPYDNPLDALFAAEVIAERHLKTLLNQRLGEVAPIVNSNPEKARDMLAQLLVDTTFIRGQPMSTSSRQMLEAFRDRYLEMEQRDGSLVGLSSPWPSVDAESLGLQPGELTVVYAKRKVGKSWLTCAWAVHCWENDLTPDDCMLFVTLEMTPMQILSRMACIALKLPWQEFRKTKLTTIQRTMLMDWIDARLNNAGNEPQIIFLGANDVREARDVALRAKEYRPKLVVVDGFYILGREDGKSIYERVLGNVQRLKLDVAAECEVPVLASTQLKGTVKKDVLDADSDDAMGAKAIGDYADVTRGLFANEQLLNENRRVWKAMESREFIGANVLINFDLEKMDFSEIEIWTGEQNAPEPAKGGAPAVQPPNSATLKITAKGVAASIGDIDDEDEDVVAV